MSTMRIAVQQSQKSGRRKTSKVMSAEVSPDSKCPICLDRFHNISYLDICLHKFCFRCIHEWSKNKAECPLCKQPFNSIYHSIKSEQDFKKYNLRPLDNGSFGTFGGLRFRYRTTLTGVHRQMQRRTSSHPDNVVVFEASRNAPQQLRDRYIHGIMMRRAPSERRSRNSANEQEMINFRRDLYQRGLRVRSVRNYGRSQDTSAQFFQRNPTYLHRLVPWVRRELTVLYGAHGSLVNIVQHVIMSQITRYDLEDSVIQEELRPFLQGRTDHFLHEFISFAKSPLNMEAYDQHAVYDCPAPSNEVSSPNMSVIAISEDEEHPLELDPPGESTSSLSHSVWDDETPGPSYSTTAEQSRAECLSVLDSDSDSSLEETQEFRAFPERLSPLNETNVIDGGVHKEECLSSDSDDCVIIGFVKPMAERTPELVKLSSDSDESASEDTKEMPLSSRHIRFSSLSPIASQSTDPRSTGQSENVETDHYHPLDSKERCSSSPSRRHKRCGKSDKTDTDKRLDSSNRSRERHRSKDRDHRRRRGFRSGERVYSSKSPVVSHSSLSTVSKEKGFSYSSSRDSNSKVDSNYKCEDGVHTHQSYRHYRLERNSCGMDSAERQSYNHSRRRCSDKRFCSRSRSREPRRQERRRSRSRTYSGSRSPSAKKRCHQEKPGGKRKYKARHLEDSPENFLSNSRAKDDSPRLLTKRKKKSKEKRRKRSKERSRKTSRSLSTELVNEENSNERSRRHHKKKKKHKKKSKRHKSSERRERGSPSVITIDSDSDSFANDGVTNKDTPITDDTANSAPPYFNA